MTKRGIFSLAFEFFLLIMALGTDIRIFLIVAVCMGALLLYSFLSLFLAVFTLSFRSTVSETEVQRGDTVEYTLHLRGVVVLPIVGRITLKPADNGDINDKDALRHAFFLIPDFKIERQYVFKLLCAHIGYWDIGVKKLRISDMFGMFSMPLVFTRRKKFTARLAVLPQIHRFETDTDFLNASRGFGDTALLNSESGEILGDSRTYREGDALRRINWKQSIRTRKLFTRQYELPEIPKIVIAVDSACGNDIMGNITDMYVESVTALSNYYMNSGHGVNIVTVRYAKSISPINIYYDDINDLGLLMYDMVSIPFFTDKAPLDLFRLNDKEFANADKIFIITANPSAGMFSAIEGASRQGKSVVCIMPLLTEEPSATLQKAIEDAPITPVIIRGVDDISEKVGQVL